MKGKKKAALLTRSYMSSTSSRRRPSHRPGNHLLGERLCDFDANIEIHSADKIVLVEFDSPLSQALLTAMAVQEKVLAAGASRRGGSARPTPVPTPWSCRSCTSSSSRATRPRRARPMLEMGLAGGS